MKQQKPSGHHKKVPPALADLLKSRREAEGLTVSQMAAKLDISRPYLARLESGEHKHPSPAVLSRMSELMGIKPEDLYALTGCLLPKDLPAFIPYLRAIHPDWPDDVITELDDIHDFLRYKYSLD